MITGRNMLGDIYACLKVLYGLSSDEKPNGSWNGRVVGNGSIFHEIDTGDEYMYDGTNERWIKQP